MGHAEKQRTVDFAAEDEDSLLVWLLGLQQIIAFWANPKVPESEQWTMPKLHLQKLRLKVSGESDKTGRGRTTWCSQQCSKWRRGRSKVTRRRGCPEELPSAERAGQVQTAVQEMMEIAGLLEDLAQAEKDLKAQQEKAADTIQQGLAAASGNEAPPRMPSERDLGS